MYQREGIDKQLIKTSCGGGDYSDILYYIADENGNNLGYGSWNDISVVEVGGKPCYQLLDREDNDTRYIDTDGKPVELEPRKVVPFIQNRQNSELNKLKEPEQTYFRFG